MRRLRSGSVLVIGSLLLTLGNATPAGAGVEPNPDRTLSFKAAVTGTPNPYTLGLTVENENAFATLRVSLTRAAAAGGHPTQTHTWEVRGVTFACTANVTSCSIDTGMKMGNFGRTQLSFAGTGPLTTTSTTSAYRTAWIAASTRRGPAR